MKSLKIVATLAAISLLQVGCTSTPETASGPVSVSPMASVSVPSGRSLLYLYRTKEFAGSANQYRITVNGTPVADMGVGTVVQQEVPPGSVTLAAETVPNILNFGLGLALQERPTVTFNAPSGSAVAFEVSAGFSGGPVLTPKPLDEAQAASAGFKPSQAPSG